ncbi:hypothetical protein IV203_000741 [Nitzschia inconspicua]|uniref:Uncharacterized protein n=1 Tax=Nitzschia inconspicua TaxID=303405 RepID=A0A9K3L734_9STRA|nr:hypothetical protein IV203_000741 [Nitzschia inconspicua]
MAIVQRRVLPLCPTASTVASREQMAKHVKFSKLVVDEFWGLPPRTKALLIHYDEKWFNGFVGRANAKMAEKVGLDKVQAFLHHKSHINKVMCVSFTGYAFEGNMENGGHGLKLSFYRCNAAKIAKKQVWQSRRDEHGNLRYDGEIKRKKGDCYMVDCVVTGSDQGTSHRQPKVFIEIHIWGTNFSIGAVASERQLRRTQGDNAGPHIDAEYINYVKGYCVEKGWVWAPQAPPMPHANNLDLAIFPVVDTQPYLGSTRTPKLLQKRSGRQHCQFGRIFPTRLLQGDSFLAREFSMK